MCDALPAGLIQLVVPADPTMVLVIRLTTAGVLARARLPVDAIDDLKMAVEESCAILISQKCPPKNIYLDFLRKERSVEITIYAEPNAACVCEMEPGEIEVVRAILATLADSAKIDLVNGRIENILLTKDL